MPTAVPPLLVMKAAVSSQVSLFLPTMATAAPSPAKAIATPRPIPRLPPVMMATLFFNLTIYPSYRFLLTNTNNVVILL